MKIDVDTALKDIADFYIKNRREMTEPELETILKRHCESEAEVQKFVSFLETEPGQLRFKTLLRERKGHSALGKTTTRKEAWQMTRAEFTDFIKTMPRQYREALWGYDERLMRDMAVQAAETGKSQHQLFIEKALSEGKSVPPEVLKDYPDLQKPSTLAERKVTSVTLSQKDLQDLELAVGKENLAKVSERANQIIKEEGVSKAEAIESAIREIPLEAVSPEVTARLRQLGRLILDKRDEIAISRTEKVPKLKDELMTLLDEQARLQEATTSRPKSEKPSTLKEELRFKPGEIVKYKGEKVRVSEQIGDRVNIFIPSRQELVWVRPESLEREPESEKHSYLKEEQATQRRCARCGKYKPDVKYRSGTGLWLCDECFRLWAPSSSKKMFELWDRQMQSSLGVFATREEAETYANKHFIQRWREWIEIREKPA